MTAPSSGVTDSLAARPVAIVGAGVIGAGWAARWRLNGHDVKVFDPSPAAPTILDEVFALAQTAWSDLGLATSRAGTVTMASSIADAVGDAPWVQESVPEVLDIKRSTLGEVASHAAADAIIASSTSGFRPSVLTDGLSNADRFIVAHPFNPVYLLPLVEVVGSATTGQGTIDRAVEMITALGMKPLVVRAEIDAHIADRLLEAVWREALWLVNDGVATTAEIDDAITYGFGLRWAQMGLFETYRIAGGQGGMAHFLSQFGPALQWPWTKLTDVPDLTEELIETIASQSDAQSGRHTVRELESIRDRNLVAILRALEDNGWGAGAHLGLHRDRIAGKTNPTGTTNEGTRSGT